MNANVQVIADRIKELLVENLGLEADMLTYDVALFGDEIGLDSIDSLEIIGFIDAEWGVAMSGVGKQHFYSIETLANYVAENQ